MTPSPQPDVQSLLRRRRRELAHRVSGRIEVALYWSEHDGTTSIEVWQPATEEFLDFRVPREQALDAFYHPFAHLPAGCRSVSLAAA